MKLMTFTGETPAVALRKAQEECGEEAMVVGTKEIRKKTMTSPALYEIVVAIDESIPTPVQAPSKPEPLNQKSFESLKEAISDISAAAREINKISDLQEPLAPPKPPVPQTDNEDVKKIKDELAKLNDKVKLIQNMVWDKGESHRDGLIIPSEFAEIYRVTKESGIAKEHLESIMRETAELMPLAMRQNSQTVRRYFNVLLRKMIPIRQELRVTPPHKKFLMLVGPTGVGKTTTLAKLAARYAFGKERAKVGILTLDTYRIGAVEQLMHYAKMMRLPIEAVNDVTEFSRSLQALRHCDYILIDTVGSSPNDQAKIDKIKEFLKTDESGSIDVTLVVSATAKLEDLRDIYHSFSRLSVDTLVITKLDESRSFGNILSLLYEIKKPLSYFSTGQEVPDDLMEADNDFLIRCLFDGFSRIRS